MTATARRFQKGARAITTGKQLLGQLHGPATHVGPNALLRSGSYPSISYYPPQAGGPSGPLTAVPFTGTYAYMRIDGSSEFGDGGICTNWAGAPSSPAAAPAYTYNNHPSNLGGTVPAGGMMIDGWEVPAGAYVFQFMDVSWGGCDILDGAPSLVFRGCRARGGAGSTGFWTLSDSSYAGNLWFLYCDSGALSASNVAYDEGCIKATYSGGFTCYRNYLSLSTTMLQPGDQSNNIIDLFENYLEQITLYTGSHLNGITFGGTQPNARLCRNNIVMVTPDGNGNDIIQTDCISFFQDVGDYPGTGTNPDGTAGYQVIGNYLGGTGYCLYGGNYGGSDPVPVNMNWVNNLVTASVYPVGGTIGGASGYGGGYNGPVDGPPPWGSDGNTHSNNIWADGASKGETWA